MDLSDLVMRYERISYHRFGASVSQTVEVYLRIQTWTPPCIRLELTLRGSAESTYWEIDLHKLRFPEIGVEVRDKSSSCWKFGRRPERYRSRPRFYSADIFLSAAVFFSISRCFLLTFFSRFRRVLFSRSATSLSFNSFSARTRLSC